MPGAPCLLALPLAPFTDAALSSVPAVKIGFNLLPVSPLPHPILMLPPSPSPRPCSWSPSRGFPYYPWNSRCVAMNSPEPPAASG